MFLISKLDKTTIQPNKVMIEHCRLLKENHYEEFTMPQSGSILTLIATFFELYHVAPYKFSVTDIPFNVPFDTIMQDDRYVKWVNSIPLGDVFNIWNTADFLICPTLTVFMEAYFTTTISSNITKACEQLNTSPPMVDVVEQELQRLDPHFFDFLM